MAERDAVIEFCDRTLNIGDFLDYGPNGLQVPGRPQVERVASAVSAHRASIEGAIAVEADLLLTHHGLFWDFHPRALSDAMAGRLRSALAAELSIAGYHLPLDAHPEHGNNALLAQALGLQVDGESAQRFAEVKGQETGIVARAPTPIPVEEFESRIAEALGRSPLRQGAGPDEITTVGVVTGSAAGEIHTAIALGLDAFVTGEPAEHAMADAVEGGIHFFAAGHYATETLGIKRLGDAVAEKFDIEHRFLDYPNPV